MTLLPLPLTLPDRAEAERVAALHRYGVLDAPADAELDDVVRAAALVAGCRTRR